MIIHADSLAVDNRGKHSISNSQALYQQHSLLNTSPLPEYQAHTPLYPLLYKTYVIYHGTSTNT